MMPSWMAPSAGGMDIKEEGIFPSLSSWPSWPNHASPFDLDRIADSWTNFDIDPIRYMDFNYNDYSDMFKNAINNYKLNLNQQSNPTATSKGSIDMLNGEVDDNGDLYGQIHHASQRAMQMQNVLGNTANGMTMPSFMQHPMGKAIGGRKHPCKMCNQVLDSKTEYQMHVQSHMREPKPYKCQQCTKSFANSSYLSQHMRIHLGIKPYHCEVCKKKFTQLSHLQQHHRTHTGDKPYKCPHPNCTKAFSQLSNLQSHSRCHQSDKPFKCNSCYKCFFDEQALLEHIPKHKDSKHLKTHICNFCGKSYTQETYLQRHMSKHNDKIEKQRNALAHVKTTGETYWPKQEYVGQLDHMAHRFSQEDILMSYNHAYGYPGYPSQHAIQNQYAPQTGYETVYSHPKTMGSAFSALSGAGRNGTCYPDTFNGMKFGHNGLPDNKKPISAHLSPADPFSSLSNVHAMRNSFNGYNNGLPTMLPEDMRKDGLIQPRY